MADGESRRFTLKRIDHCTRTSGEAAPWSPDRVTVYLGDGQGGSFTSYVPLYGAEPGP
jgi:hypothetical protein